VILLYEECATCDYNFFVVKARVAEKKGKACVTHKSKGYKTASKKQKRYKDVLILRKWVGLVTLQIGFLRCLRWSLYDAMTVIREMGGVRG
jgi:hypothetical protein